MGEGHIRLVEYVSMKKLFHSLGLLKPILYRQIFGSIPKNIEEEDMVQPNVSTLALLKEQRARKAAAKKAAEDSETESETQPEPSENLNLLPASENPPSASENPLVTPTRLSWNFSDEAATPSVFHNKDGTRSEHQAQADIAQLEHNPPIRRSTPPFATTANNKLCHREPSPQPQLRHTSQASSSQKRRSSPAKKSRRPKI